jgi:hypothetical protein
MTNAASGNTGGVFLWHSPIDNLRMSGADWTRSEVEAIVEDYLSMLASELAGVPYNKASHRRALLPRLRDRSEQSVEFKHANISAALLEAGFPYIGGYKPRSNYQALLAEVVAEQLDRHPSLFKIAEADADRPMVVPEVDDILKVLTNPPKIALFQSQVAEPSRSTVRLTTNYIEREARNRSLGSAGEDFVLNYERARLIFEGCESLAAKIEHTSKVRGDGAGYDILSYDGTGAERLIEVKTTKYGSDTPFFVTRNEVATSDRYPMQYQVYRLFSFRESPRLYTLAGSIGATCQLSAATFLARPR